MDFAILAPVEAGVTADRDWIAEFAVHAQSCGFESIVTVEHTIVVTKTESRYPYSRSGEFAFKVDCDVPDPLDVLAYLAGCTDRIGLATGLVVLPNHSPVVLAKRAATIDKLSGGRLRLCVGVGWMQEEVEACGADFSTRGVRVDESIDVMRALWAETGPEGTSFHGRFVSFDGAHSYPKPVGRTGVPIHIGGHSIAAARRAGRRGDGFQPIGVRGEELDSLLRVMREEAEAAGRDPSRIELSLGGLVSRTTPESVETAASLGANRMVLAGVVSSDLARVKDELSEFAETMHLS